MFTTSQKPIQAIRRVGWPARCCQCLFLLSVLFINLKHPSSNSATGSYKAGRTSCSFTGHLEKTGTLFSKFQGLWCPWQNSHPSQCPPFPPWSTPGLLRGHRCSSCLLHSYPAEKQSKDNLFCIYVQTISTVLCIYNVLITAVCLSLGLMLIQHIYPLVLFWRLSIITQH